MSVIKQININGTLYDINAINLTNDNVSISGTKTFVSSPKVPTPSSGDDSLQAANTKYVDDNCVHLTGAETIAGTKTFVTLPVLGVLTKGSSTVPVYLSAGTVTACSGAIGYVAGSANGVPKVHHYINYSDMGLISGRIIYNMLSTSLETIGDWCPINGRIELNVSPDVIIHATCVIKNSSTSFIIHGYVISSTDSSSISISSTNIQTYNATLTW